MNGGRASPQAWILLGAALLATTEASGQRRGLRVDAGAWDVFQPIASPACPHDIPGESRLLLGALTFSGLGGTGLLAGASCQYTRATALNGASFTPGDQDGLAALIGPNADGQIGAMRYTFANDPDPMAASRAFQW